MLRRTLLAATAVVAAGLWAGSAHAPARKIVKGPGAEPSCFKPWSDQTKFFQWTKKDGPYRIALVNGFVGNTWRIQMIKTAKAFAEQPDIKDEHQGVQGRLDRHRRRRPARRHRGLHQPGLRRASSPSRSAPDGFDRVIQLADKNDVVVVPFDNILDTDKVMMVNEDQKEMGRHVGQLAHQGDGQEGRQDPRGARRARQLGRPRPPSSASAR